MQQYNCETFTKTCNEILLLVKESLLNLKQLFMNFKLFIMFYNVTLILLSQCLSNYKRTESSFLNQNKLLINAT